MNRTISWHIVTGEYPPQPGGVADYTRLLARELVRAGDEVQVWCSECAGAAATDPGVAVTRLPGRFGRRALRMLGAALDQAPRPYRLLVQYVPHMYGMRGMNLPFCWWLRSRRADGPWVMFHEVTFPIVPGQKLTHRLLALVQRRMAGIVAGAATRVWMSIPAWESILRELTPTLAAPEWLPVPSNMPTERRLAAWSAIRERLGVKPGDLVVGHFGTYGEVVGGLLAAMLPAILRNESRLGLLVGRGADAFAARLQAANPNLTGRLRVAADLDAQAVADHLGASDVLLQPYPDGVSSRRTSTMTGLALGIPTVTSIGALSEPIWAADRLVMLAPADDTAAHVALVDRLLEHPEERRELGERAAFGYARSFGVEHAVGKLRAAADSRDGGT